MKISFATLAWATLALILCTTQAQEPGQLTGAVLAMGAGAGAGAGAGVEAEGQGDEAGGEAQGGAGAGISLAGGAQGIAGR